MRLLKNRPPAKPEQDFLITAIGYAGDGMARLPNGSVAAIPFTLPGETVRAAAHDRRYQLLEVLAPSPDRITPPCPHFGQCGGCALQHWSDAQYAAWKRGLAVSALERAGFAAPNVLPLQRTPPASRRRIDFAVRRGARLALGLHARGSGEVLDIETCAILHPDIARLLPSLRAMLPTLPGIRGEASCLINLLGSGPDLLIRSTVEAGTEDLYVTRCFWGGRVDPAYRLGPWEWRRGDRGPDRAVLPPFR